MDKEKAFYYLSTFMAGIIIGICMFILLMDVTVTNAQDLMTALESSQTGYPLDESWQPQS